MNTHKKIRNLVVCIIITLFSLPIGTFADTDDNLNNADYIPNQEAEAGSPNIGTNEYGDTFYEGDYNDYEHTESTERTITLMLPYQLDGRSCELTVNGETGSGTLDNGDIVFTVPFADEYNISVDTSDIDMPDDILTTNIPGASLSDEGDITVRIDLGTAWTGAVFSAQSELSLYEVAFSVDNDGILTVCADTYQDITIYINYGGDELYPVYEEGDPPEEDNEDEDIIMEGSSEDEYNAYLESIGVDPNDENLDEAIAEAEDAKETESEVSGTTANQKTETESENSGTTVMIIVVVVIVVLIIAGVIIYYVIRNRNRGQYKVDESVYDDDNEDENDDSDEENDNENDDKN